MLIIVFNTNAYTQNSDTLKLSEPNEVKPKTNLPTHYKEAISINEQSADTTDSTANEKPLRPKIKEGSFDTKVDYKAKDSLRFNIKKQLVYLFGDAELNYEKINLRADYIELDLQKNEVFAQGTADSTGKETGRPVFKDDSQEFKAKNIRYNFSSKKGLITEALTQQGDGYVKGETVKRLPNEVIYIENGQFCPCKDIDAKTYILAKKIKIIPEDKVITGPANMKIGNIPTPLLLPFGIFPNQKGAASGLIIPRYGYSPGQGYFLQEGGFYWAFNEYLDFSFTGDLYSRGSWGLGLASSYKKRYHSNGNVQMRFTQLKRGAEETKDLEIDQIYKIYWKHNQDNKARPNGRFSALIDVYKNNQLDINSTQLEFQSNTYKSNINYYYKFPNSPFRITLNGSYTVNNTTHRADLTLPEAALNMDRIYPFKRKHKVGKDKFYEKIGLSYNTYFINKLSAHPDSIFNPKKLANMKNGVKQNISMRTNTKILGVFSLEPFVEYNEFWEFKELNQRFSVSENTIVKDTLNKFGRFGKLDGGASLTTKIYGMYSFRRGPVKAIRHVFTPSVSLTLTPNYEHADYIRTYQIDSVGSTGKYTLYDNGVFGSPNTGKESGLVSFKLINNLEMKVVDKKDTSSEKVYKKVKLFDQFNVTSNYNIFADSLNLNSIRITTSTSLFNVIQLQYNSALDPYTYEQNSSGSIYRVNKLELYENGKIGRFLNHNLAINFSMSNKKKLAKKKNAIEEMKKSIYTYMVIPWKLSVGYNFNYNQPNDLSSRNITQGISLRGNINITENWKFEGSLNYDIKDADIPYSRFSIYRDLNCWEARISVVPKGAQQNYNFSINLKPSMFKDLKIERKRNYYDF